MKDLSSFGISTGNGSKPLKRLWEPISDFEDLCENTLAINISNWTFRSKIIFLKRTQNNFVV